MNPAIARNFLLLRFKTNPFLYYGQSYTIGPSNIFGFLPVPPHDPPAATPGTLLNVGSEFLPTFNLR